MNYIKLFYIALVKIFMQNDVICNNQSFQVFLMHLFLSLILIMDNIQCHSNSTVPPYDFNYLRYFPLLNTLDIISSDSFTWLVLLHL